MSWIQENRFAAGLGGFTAVAAIGLIVWALSERSSYSAAKDAYQEASDKMTAMESKSLYPDQHNKSAKDAAVSEYAELVEKLQKNFDAYRSGEIKNVDPAVFTEQLKKVKTDTEAALTAAGVKDLNPNFFLGFEDYTHETVKGGATGILSYELGAAAELFAQLAAAKPDKVTNVFRVKLDEENNGTFDAKGKSVRPLTLEVSFQGNEASLRSFLNSLDASKKYFYVVRTLKVSNTNQTAPTAAAAQFKAEDGSAAPGAAAPDDGGIVLPGETPATPAAPAADSGLILQKVLGAEKVNVFLRIDILQFLAPLPMPKA